MGYNLQGGAHSMYQSLASVLLICVQMAIAKWAEGQNDCLLMPPRRPTCALSCLIPWRPTLALLAVLIHAPPLQFCGIAIALHA